MKTFVNSYFENCYTSGSIEGNSKLGGFIDIVFDDTRAYNSGNSNRGKAVFRNCYSTSSVGMQYSGSNVGGFAGLIVGNIQAAEATSHSRQHVFENCYAAGEVGGITTDTSTGDDNTNSIGGFMGSYVNYKSEAAGNNPSVSEIISIKEQNNSLSIVNCYYDKQTTAMRERDVYYTKTLRMTTASAKSAVGWYRGNEYRLTTLIIEAIDEANVAHEMTRIDVENANSEFGFSEAEYQYDFKGYSVTQNPETKVFSVVEN